MEAFTFQCSICGDRSTKLCVNCTKDACNNHLCDRCHRCSDCCLCDLPANAPEAVSQAEIGEQLSPDSETGNETPEPHSTVVRNGIFSH
jgi:hypothetical protein